MKRKEVIRNMRVVLEFIETRAMFFLSQQKWIEALNLAIEELEQEKDTYNIGYNTRDKQIVRCGECKSFSKNGYCDLHGNGNFEYKDFCSYGERGECDE